MRCKYCGEKLKFVDYLFLGFLLKICMTCDLAIDDIKYENYKAKQKKKYEIYLRKELKRKKMLKKRLKL